jgi:cell division protease FtsH
VTAREIDSAIKTIVDVAFRRAREILLKHRDSLEVGAGRLLERETLVESDLARIFARVTVPDITIAHPQA